jgi:hypothetical protein
VANTPAPLPETMSRDEMLRYYSEYANMVCGEVTVYQRRIRNLQAVLQQALEALDTCDGDEDGYKGPVQWFNPEKVEAASAALRSALCGNDAEKDAEIAPDSVAPKP